MALLIDILSGALLLAGSFFLVVGGIGLNRMPDLFTRLQATGVSDTVGAAGIFLGLMLQAGFTLVTVKLLFLLLIFLFTTPVATHAVTRAALLVGVEPRLFDERGRARRALIREVHEARTAAQPQLAGRKQAARTRAGKPKGGRSSKR